MGTSGRPSPASWETAWSESLSVFVGNDASCSAGQWAPAAIGGWHCVSLNTLGLTGPEIEFGFRSIERANPETGWKESGYEWTLRLVTEEKKTWGINDYGVIQSRRVVRRLLTRGTECSPGWAWTHDDLPVLGPPECCDCKCEPHPWLLKSLYNEYSINVFNFLKKNFLQWKTSSCTNSFG